MNNPFEALFGKSFNQNYFNNIVSNNKNKKVNSPPSMERICGTCNWCDGENCSLLIKSINLNDKGCDKWIKIK